MAQEIDFFEGRREVEFGDFRSLKTTGNERRVKIDMRIPISNHSMVGMPSWVSQGHEIVVKDKSFYTKALCKDVRMEGMSLLFFSTDTVKRKMRTLNGATLDKFSVERVGKDDKAQTYLNLIAYCPCSLDIIQWCYESQGATLFVEFDSTQASFSYDGEEEEEEGDGEEQGELGIEEEDDDTHVIDPNDDPDAPIPNDTRSVTKPTDPPRKRSHHKKK